MIRNILGESINALKHYRLRSGLTMLSVIWGVASLILLLSYGNGFTLTVTKGFESIGKDLIIVFPGQTSLQAGGERAGRKILLEARDVQFIADRVPTIQAISPELQRILAVSFGYRTREYSVSGINPPFQIIRNLELEQGRFISEDDIRNRRRVAVIGSLLKQELLMGDQPLEKNITIKGVRFTIIGVLKKKVQMSNYYPPDDISVFVPFPVQADLVDARYLSNIAILPANGPFRARITREIRLALSALHYFDPTDERAAWIIDWAEFRSTINNLNLALSILLTVLGTLTLGIGTVGVMNIMLVSVGERTREIGVLKSLGARRRLILAQFLMEGLTITGLGGILGLIVAIVAIKLVGTLPLLGPLYKDTSGTGDIHLGLSASALIVASVVLIITGLISSAIPALRAANLEPVEALRSE